MYPSNYNFLLVLQVETSENVSHHLKNVSQIKPHSIRFRKSLKGLFWLNHFPKCLFQLFLLFLADLRSCLSAEEMVDLMWVSTVASQLNLCRRKHMHTLQASILIHQHDILYSYLFKCILLWQFIDPYTTITNKIYVICVKLGSV